MNNLPLKWETKKLIQLATINMGQSPDSSTVTKENNGIPFLQGNADFNKTFPTPKSYCSKPLKMAKVNDILISVRAPVGDMNVANYDYCIGRGLAAITCKYINTWFCWYALHHEKHQLFRVKQGSTFEAVNKLDLSNILISVPPLQEQKKIAAILLSVDRVIETTKDAIAQLQIVKRGLIQQLLTKGIPSWHNEYQDTKLGQIPIDWKINKIGEITELVTSGSRGWAKYYSTKGALFIRITNLSRKSIELDLKDLKRVDIPNKIEGQRSRLYSGDLLISITADLGIVGIAADDIEEAYINQHIALVRFNKNNVYPRFAAYWLSSEIGQFQFRRLNDAGAKAGLSLPNIRSINISIPPLPEQKKIADILTSVDKRIEAEEAKKAQAEIIKKGLMQQLLTGKIRVKV